MRLFVPVMTIVLMACTSSHEAEMSMTGAGSPDAPSYGEAVVRAHAAIRAATKPFHALDVAVAAGYAERVAKCFTDSTSHHGAMGYHHVNRAYVDSILELEKPEILLYERQKDGIYVLNGVEYILPYRYWPRDSVPPTLMGRELFRDDEREYWYVHVWAWKANPAGLFADWNPDVKCPAEPVEGTS